MGFRAMLIAKRQLATILVLPFLTACRNQFPTAPSDVLTEGIVVYVDANFQGAAWHVTKDYEDLAELSGPCVHNTGFPGLADPHTAWDWNDCISSVRVAPGWMATLYRDDGYRDDSITIRADMPNLTLAPHDCPRGGLNDCVTSIRVHRQ
jgi:hypothetical protein